MNISMVALVVAVAPPWRIWSRPVTSIGSEAAVTHSFVNDGKERSVLVEFELK